VRLIAGLIGISVDGLTDTQVANEVVQSIKELSASVKIPAGLAEFGITEAQLPVLAENALKDACMATNPIPPTKEDLIQILRNAL
jgi:alcohol dehydrogenase